MTKDQAVMVLTFVAGVLSLAATQAFVPANIQPFLLFGVGVINLALATFFGIVKPVAAAFRAGTLSLKK